VRAAHGEKGIGTIISSVVVACVPAEILFWGPRISESWYYMADQKNGATMLHIMLGHILDPFIRIFGDIDNDTVAASQTIAFPNAVVCDATGKATGTTIPVTSPDQLSVSGLTKENVLFTFHYRAGLPLADGRTNFLWLIDGSEGSIRLEGDGLMGSFLNMTDPTLFVNGHQVHVPVDPLDNISRAWTEFARGGEADYATAEDAVKVLQVINAVQKSAAKEVL